MKGGKVEEAREEVGREEVERKGIEGEVGKRRKKGDERRRIEGRKAG